MCGIEWCDVWYSVLWYVADGGVWYHVVYNVMWVQYGIMWCGCGMVWDLVEWGELGCRMVWGVGFYDVAKVWYVV